MRRTSLRVLSVLAVALSVFSEKTEKDITKIYKNPLANGFGDDINWVKWEDAIETALEVDKPIFLLVHKSWCHACKALQKTMLQSNARKAFKKLSENFVMVNAVDDEEPFEEEYRPDGKYIPRLLFLDKNGDLLPEFKNKKAEYKNYSYYYSSPADILNSMKDVLRHFGVEVPEDRKGDKLKPKKPEKPEKKLDGPEPPNDAKTKKQEEAKKDKDEDAKKSAQKDAKAEL
ncbi:Protein Y57A10A.23 [Aphelenchoides avenae]|nr:Protein Y57A10A.23 [Aphelenchus avenae]